jgi:hypothetical protein
MNLRREIWYRLYGGVMMRLLHQFPRRKRAADR